MTLSSDEPIPEGGLVVINPTTTQDYFSTNRLVVVSEGRRGTLKSANFAQTERGLRAILPGSKNLLLRTPSYSRICLVEFLTTLRSNWEEMPLLTERLVVNKLQIRLLPPVRQAKS